VQGTVKRIHFVDELHGMVTAIGKKRVMFDNEAGLPKHKVEREIFQTVFRVSASEKREAVIFQNCRAAYVLDCQLFRVGVSRQDFGINGRDELVLLQHSQAFLREDSLGENHHPLVSNATARAMGFHPLLRQTNCGIKSKNVGNSKFAAGVIAAMNGDGKSSITVSDKVGHFP